MTSDSDSIPSPNREVDEDERRFYHNLGVSSRGIRQKTLERVVSLSTIIRYDYRTQGAVYQRWIERKDDDTPEEKADFVCGLGPSDFDALGESAREIFPESKVVFLTEISDRTAWDYLKTLQYFYLSDSGLAHIDRLRETEHSTESHQFCHKTDVRSHSSFQNVGQKEVNI